MFKCLCLRYVFILWLDGNGTSDCPDSSTWVRWVNINGNCYTTSRHTKARMDSVISDCDSIGAVLTSIATYYEYDLIAKYISRTYCFIGCKVVLYNQSSHTAIQKAYLSARYHIRPYLIERYMTKLPHSPMVRQFLRIQCFWM